MHNLKSAIILLASSLAEANAQRFSETNGFGSGPEIYSVANQNPLNKTSVNFSGFDLNADPASTDNATSGQWTWNAGLSIINTETNETNYPISGAANSTSNIINVAYTLDFPGGQLAPQNDTNWTICANIIDIDWTTNVLGRASRDPGDCSVVLGESCLNKLQQAWRGGGMSSIGCPSGPDIRSISECNSISTDGYNYYTSSIMSYLSDPNDRNSTRVGLKSGQIFSYQSGRLFDASQAQATYNEYASALRMMVLTFAPSENFVANHSSIQNSGEVRTFCSLLNSKAPRPNAASSLSAYQSIGMLVATWWTLLSVWQML